MKTAAFYYILIISLLFGRITTTSALNTQNNQVTLTVSLCDNTGGTGDYLAEIYGIDLTGAVRDYRVTQDSGNFVFQDVASGVYEIAVYREGYQLYKHDSVSIQTDYQEAIVLQKNLFPPQNLTVDTKTLIAQWEAPQMVLLNENFEDTLFPPENWQGVQFKRSNNMLSPHIGSWPSWFAVEPVNGYKSDYAELITPPVDMRQASHFKLCFDYFFKSNYGESAKVQVSYDGGTTWDIVAYLNPSTSWYNDSIDLDFISGVNGNRTTLFKFSFGFTTGFYDPSAIDNVEIKSELPVPDSYTFMLDGQNMAVLPGTVLSDTLTCLSYGEQHQISIFADYSCGVSNLVSYDFTSHLLPLVQKPFLSYLYGDSTVQFQLQAVNTCDSTWQNEGLLSFNLFRDDVLIGNFPYDTDQGTVVYAFDTPDVGAHHYCASALYDLGYWGFPGQTDESATVCDNVFVAYGKTIPFTEDWSSGSFEWNNWSADPDFSITADTGMPSPAAIFSPPQNGQSYQQYLTSDNLLTDRFKVGAVWFDYDVKSEDTTYNPSQFYQSKIRYANGTWDWLDEASETPNNDWESKHIDITQNLPENVAAVRFIVQGDGSQPRIKWYFDNIHIYRTCQEPGELYAAYIWDGTFGIKVRWYFHKSSVTNENRGLAGFNIYRKSDSMSDYELYDFVPFTDNGYYIYKDLYPAVNPYTGYFYKVCAFYADADDSLESAFAHAFYNPDDDYVYAFVTGQKENHPDEQVKVYPNPAQKKVLVSAPFVMDKVILYNNKGEKLAVYQHLKSKKTTFILPSLSTGIYLLSIQGDGHTVSKKILIK